MTCKDCIHYVVCWRVKEVETGNPMITSYHICRAFKDKSRFIELPCKVGDTVYCFEPYFDENLRSKLKVKESKIVQMRTIATVLGFNFDIEKIGETVFLTKEEAEKNMKERNRK